MSVISKRYAEALIKIGVETSCLGKYQTELDLLLEIINDVQVKDILFYPGIAISKKKELIQNAFGENFDKNIINLLILLLERGRLKNINEIASDYKEMVNKYLNIINLEIISTKELEKDQIDSIKEKISREYNSNNIKIETTIDTSIIGGIKLKLGDKIIDGTIKTRLDNMQKAIEQNN